MLTKVDKKFHNVNIINFSEVNTRGGGLIAYQTKLDNIHFIPFPYVMYEVIFKKKSIIKKYSHNFR